MTHVLLGANFALYCNMMMLQNDEFKIGNSFGVRMPLEQYVGIVGISIGNRYFSKKRLKKYLKFVAENFNEVLVIVVDDVKKYNFVSFSGNSFDEALNKADKEGKEYLRMIEKVLKSLEADGLNLSNIQVIRWKDAIKKNSMYLAYLHEMKVEFNHNPVFKNDVLRMVKDYADKRFPDKLFEKNTLEYSANFIIEELAFFSTLNDNREKQYIDVYPGRFYVAENVSKGKYADLTKRLKIQGRYAHIEAYLYEKAV